MFYDFKMQFKQVFIIILNVNVERRLFLKLKKISTTFIAYFIMLGPTCEWGSHNIWKANENQYHDGSQMFFKCKK
jgi:hypothetical protein